MLHLLFYKDGWFKQFTVNKTLDKLPLVLQHLAYFIVETEAKTAFKKDRFGLMQTYEIHSIDEVLEWLDREYDIGL